MISQRRLSIKIEKLIRKGWVEYICLRGGHHH